MADAKTRVEDKQDKPGETFNVINEWGTYVSTYTQKKKLWGEICARDNKVLFDHFCSIK